MFSLTIFGVLLHVSVASLNFTILECCDFIGLRLVRFCFHKQLLIAGNCRFCLCSVLGERKYVIGCFHKIKNGMQVRNISLFLKQFNFLFFLILNHPMDCPICDQVGICEIQNVFNVFGAVLNFSGYVAQPFYSLNLGIFLRFVMSRCIHCLRCVRFMREILFCKTWGFYGRGRLLQVGLYVRKFLHNNFMDSFVKICPVGALTLRVFSFEVRNWELSKIFFVNLYSCFVDYLLIGVCNSVICRVISVSSDSAFSSNWLFDNAKNIVYSAMYQRLCLPFSNLQNVSSAKRVLGLSWNSAYALFAFLLKYLRKMGLLHSFALFVNSDLDMYSLLFIKKLFISLNIYTFYSNTFFTDLLGFYKISKVEKIFESDFWFLVGLEFEKKFVSFGLKLKELWSKSNILVFCFGFFEVWTFPVYFLGSSFFLNNIAYGIAFCLRLFLKLNAGVFFFNSLLLNSPLIYNFFSLFGLLVFFKKTFVWGVLSVSTNFLGNCFLNFNFKNKQVCNRSCFLFVFNGKYNDVFFFLHNVVKFFMCYIGSFVDKIISVSTIVLPMFSFVEKSKLLFLNVLGKLRGVRGSLIKSLHYVASDFFLFNFLKNIFFVYYADSLLGRWCSFSTFFLGGKYRLYVYSSNIIFFINYKQHYNSKMLLFVFHNFVYMDVTCTLVFENLLLL